MSQLNTELSTPGQPKAGDGGTDKPRETSTDRNAQDSLCVLTSVVSSLNFFMNECRKADEHFYARIVEMNPRVVLADRK
jgi:hypothetical protein